jgi:hypothetical protein
LDLTSSLTQGQNTSTSSLPSSVTDEIFADPSSGLSESDKSAQASSSKDVVHPPLITRDPSVQRIKADRNPASRAVVHLVQAPVVELSESGHHPIGDTGAGIAPSSHRRTVKEMANQGLALKHRSDVLVTNIRGHHARSKLLAAPPAIQLAKILPIYVAPPSMEYPPTTRAIGPTGRIRVTINNQSLAELLDWNPGPLTVSPDGTWVVLRSEPSTKKRRRNDGLCTYTGDNRLRLSQAICTYLGTPFGDEVALLPLPEHGALALVNPARLLIGAPLRFFDNSSNSKQGGI